MSLLKAQIRTLLTNEIGADLEDQLENSRREVQQQEGAKAAFSTAREAVGQLLGVLQKDLSDGKYTLEQGQEISKWVQRAMAVCESLELKATHQLLIKNGAVAQSERLVALVRKRFDGEKTKYEELARLALPSDEGAPAEADPTAPAAPKSIKQLRLEEAAREAAAAQGTLEPPVLPVEPDAPPPAPVASEKHGKANGKRGKGSRGAAHA